MVSRFDLETTQPEWALVTAAALAGHEAQAGSAAARAAAATKCLQNVRIIPAA